MSDVTFFAWHEPALTAGSYSVTVGQRLVATGLPDLRLGDLAAPAPPTGSDPTVALRFATFGPRVAIDPSMVMAQFPPPGSGGHEAGVMPHIVLHDPTLPWIREDGSGRPWLAVLVFGGNEIDQLTRAATTAGALGLDDEPGQSPTEQATVLTIPAALVAKVLPHNAEVRLLAHVRERVDPATGQNEARSVVVANRMVVTGAVNEVHLVSLEGVDLDAVASAGTDLELISLVHWRFESIDNGPGFRDLALALAHNSGLLRHETGVAEADAYLQRGVVPLRHGSGVSLYRGPLAPALGDPVSAAVIDAYNNELPRRPDQLVVVDDGFGIQDISYAAAFDLGRSLMMAEHNVALDLDAMRRANRHQTHAAGQLQGLAAHRHDHGTGSRLAASVRGWVESLIRLDLVPPWYLLPDPERLLPATEAVWLEGGEERRAPGRMAFFCVDPVWVALLGYGALLVGAITQRETEGLDLDTDPRLGFVFRSPLTRWDDLEIHAFPGSLTNPNTNQPLDLQVRDLAADIRLVITNESSGPITIEIGRHPQGLHFGVEEPGEHPVKIPRTVDGHPDEGNEKAVQYRDGVGSAVKVSTLAADLGATDSAAFARHMVVGTPRIRFQLDDRTVP